MAVVLELLSVVAEVNHGSGSGVITELGGSNGISDRSVSPMLLLERPFTIIITTSTHIITIAVIETVALVARIMVLIVGIIVSVVVLLVVFPAVLVVLVALVMAFIVGIIVSVVLLLVVFPAVLVVVAAVVVHTVDDIDPGERINMSPFFAFECTQETPQSICSKDVAPSNIPCISVTADTSQADKSWLKDCAWWNIPYMRMTADTSHADKSWLKDNAW